MRIREFDSGGGESVEVRVFLVSARDLKSDEDEELARHVHEG